MPASSRIFQPRAYCPSTDFKDFSSKAFVEAIGKLAKFQKDLAPQQCLEDLLTTWGPPRLLRQLQVVCNFADFQARLVQLLHAWFKVPRYDPNLP